MALLLPTNATISIYRGFNVYRPYPTVAMTPALPSVAGHLKHHVRHGRFGSAAALKWTPLVYLPPDTDIRSAYNTQLNTWTPANADTVVFPDYPIPSWCTAFLVVLVQRAYRGTPGECLRAYLDRMQPRQGSCLRPYCCPSTLPNTVHATIPPQSGCPCLDGTFIALNYSPVTDSWSGSAVVCSNETLSLEYKCGTSSCDDASLSLAFQNHGAVGPVLTDPGCSCSPLSMVFSNINFPIQGSECGGAITVVITT
jgi:hypothetical protein